MTRTEFDRWLEERAWDCPTTNAVLQAHRQQGEPGVSREVLLEHLVMHLAIGHDTYKRQLTRLMEVQVPAVIVTIPYSDDCK